MLNRSKKKRRIIFKSIVSFLLIFSIIFTSVPTGAFVKAAGTESEESNNAEAVQTLETEPYIIGEDVSRRSENEKHFIMSDGTRVAALYDTTVHYKDEQGEFKEVDNSFESLDSDEYQTKSGKKKVKLAKKASAKKLVTLDVDGYTVSWGFEGANKVKAQVKQTEESDEKFSAKNVNGIMYYEEAFDNVDLEYIVNSDTIKENIILKSTAAQNEFEINYNIGKLEAVQKDSKTIELLSDGEVIYTISAPVMFDSADNYSSDITLEILSNKNGKLSVLCRADSTWLNGDNIVYPVTVDPSLSTQMDGSSLTCKTSFYGNEVEDASGLYSQDSATYVGFDSYYGEMNSLYYFNTLPTLAAGDYITQAIFGLYVDEAKTFPITAHEALEHWWYEDGYAVDYEVLYEEPVIDYNNVDGNTYSWDITNLVRRWYNLGQYNINNSGLVLKFSITDSLDYVCFATSKNSNTNIRPILAIHYVNHHGLEDYFSYSTVNVGAGTAYVNNASGVLTVEMPLISTKGENMPAGLTMYYNNAKATKHSNMICGAGWRTNFDQRIDAITDTQLKSNGYYYTYTDADGTINYMKAVDNTTNQYEDELGKGLTLTVAANESTLSDKDGNTCYFATTGELIKIKSGTSPSVIELTYSGGYLNTITDGSGNTLSFERNENNAVTYVVDNYGRKIYFQYSHSKLRSITGFDNSVVNFTYDSEYLFLTSITDSANFQTEFVYNTDVSLAWKGRVSFIKELSAPNSTGSRTTGDYLSFGYTDFGYTDVSDNNANTVYYLFDEAGRATSAFSDEAAVKVAYTQKDDNATHTNNKVTRQTSAGKPVENMAYNTSFEQYGHWETYTSNEDYAFSYISTDDSRLGNKSLGLSGMAGASVTYFQRFSPKKSGYYTYSVYVKVDETIASTGASAILGFVDKQGNKSFLFSRRQKASTNGEWQRLSVTGYYDTSTMSYLSIINGLNAGESGFALFDCAQLEYSETASEYNMISNGYFNDGNTDWLPDYHVGIEGVHDINSAIPSEITPLSFEKSFTLLGTKVFKRDIYQTININAKASKVSLNFGAYIHAQACKENDIAFEIEFDYSDGTSDTVTRYANHYNREWQYFCDMFTPPSASAEKTVTTATVHIKYDNNYNCIEITGIQLIADTTGMLYSYDEKGNPIKATDTGTNAVNSEYDDLNRLTSKTMQDGSTYSYEYESSVNNRLVSAQTAPNNQRTEYSYNSFGQATGSQSFNTKDASLKIQSSKSYSENGEYIQSETNSQNTTTYYSYDNKDNLSTATTGDRTTAYTYDTADRVSTVTAKQGDTSLATVGYGYTNNLLTSVTHNGFSYGFVYDSFGNTAETKVGNQLLITNDFSGTYITSSGKELTSPHLLKKSTYGNNDYVEYDYDDLERVIAKKVNGEVAYQYQYNASGNIHQVIDNVNDITYVYSYDELGRLKSIRGNDNCYVFYTYDGSNRLTAENFYYHGTTSTVNHEYLNGGALDISAFSNGSSKDYNYDSLMRLESLITKTSAEATTGWITNYSYYNPTESTTTALV